MITIKSSKNQIPRTKLQERGFFWNLVLEIWFLAIGIWFLELGTSPEGR